MAESIASAIAFLRRVAEAPPKIAALAAKRIDALVSAEFDGGFSPEGSEWAPLAASTLAKGRFPPPLTDTGALRGSVTSEAAGASIVVRVEDGKAGWHQYGTARMPARPMLPTDELPTAWSVALDDAAREVIGTAGGA